MGLFIFVSNSVQKLEPKKLDFLGTFTTSKLQLLGTTSCQRLSAQNKDEQYKVVCCINLRAKKRV
jgi:hypothetical protein